LRYVNAPLRDVAVDRLASYEAVLAKFSPDPQVALLVMWQGRI
jgi:hypothetical protein